MHVLPLAGSPASCWPLPHLALVGPCRQGWGLQASWAADPEYLTPCLAVSNLSGSVTDDVLHEAFHVIGAINSRVVPAPTAAAVTCGFVWFECGPLL